MKDRHIYIYIYADRQTEMYKIKISRIMALSFYFNYYFIFNYM